MIFEGIHITADAGSNVLLIAKPEVLGTNTGETAVLLTGEDLAKWRGFTAPDPNSNSSLKRRKLDLELRLAELQIRIAELQIARGAR